jgi:hypothetical protein
MIAQHMGGIPELAMALGPLLLIAVFIKIARSAESRSDDDPDDWDDWDDAASEEPCAIALPSSDATQRNAPPPPTAEVDRRPALRRRDGDRPGRRTACQWSDLGVRDADVVARRYRDPGRGGVPRVPVDARPPLRQPGSYFRR